MKNFKQNGLFWFRHDQRLTDNLALFRTCAQSDELLPVFVVEPGWFEATNYHAKPLGQHRWQFMQQSLIWLQQSLRDAGSDLLVIAGPAEIVLPRLVRELDISVLGCSHHCGVNENAQLENVLNQVATLELIQEEAHTLFQRNSLPFTPEQLPAHFTPFRKIVEQLEIDRPIAAPESFPPIPEKAKPLISEIALSTINKSVPFTGGGDTAQQRLRYYSYESHKLLNYKQTRNGLSHFDDSSKLSPWLANGNLSVKEAYWHIKQFERDVAANESTYWLYFELLWREDFQWYQEKHQARCFRFSGIKDKSPLTTFWPERYQKWCTGTTPWSIVNAAMRQLNSTGYMSNRARQLVASCFVHELNMDWRYGAAWFEQQLVDYDVAVNWGNWQYLAGVGADPRGHRKFDLEKQTDIYDPDGLFINSWLSNAEIKELRLRPIDSNDMVDWPID